MANNDSLAAPRPTIRNRAFSDSRVGSSENLQLLLQQFAKQKREWRGHKFGGTSMSDMEGVAAIVIHLEKKYGPNKHAVIVSAMAGITNELYAAVTKAQRRDPDWEKSFMSTVQKHKDYAKKIMNDEHYQEFSNHIDGDATHLKQTLSAISFARICSKEQENFFVGFGELWSSLMLTLYLRTLKLQNVERIDARDIVHLQAKQHSTDRDDIPQIDFNKSEEKMQDWLKAHPSCRVAIVTGFVCSNHEGMPTILGRNGSDFSSTIFANLLNAISVTIWKDVEGVYSANPKLVPDAFKVDWMNYEEAIELSNFGGQVMHPLTMIPVIQKEVPVEIRSTFKPDTSGTVISNLPEASAALPAFKVQSVKCFSHIDGLALLTVSSIAFNIHALEHIVRSFASARIEIVHLTQCPFERAARILVPNKNLATAKSVIEEAVFSRSPEHEFKLTVTENVSCVAAIGDGLVRHHKTASRFFAALQQAGITVHVTAQSSNERSFSVVVDSAQAKRAVVALHAAFLKPLREVSIGILGPSVIATELCRQLQAQSRKLEQERGVSLRLQAVMHVDEVQQTAKLVSPAASAAAAAAAADEKRPGTPTEKKGRKPVAAQTSPVKARMVKLADIMPLLAGGQDWTWDVLLGSSKAVTPNEFADVVLSSPALHHVIVDCTKDDVGLLYPSWLDAGLDVITCNQKALLEPETLAKIRERAGGWESAGSKCLYDTCVGVGQSTVAAIRQLFATGDHIIEMQGILSVTLQHVFFNFSPAFPGAKLPSWAEVVKDVVARGYTEEDIRDDFSGTYLARKLLILGHEGGLPLRLDDIKVQSLVPEPVSRKVKPNATAAEVLDAVIAQGPAMEKLRAEAMAKNEVLRYTGVVNIKNESATVEVRSVPRTSPLSCAQSLDQTLLLTTNRFLEHPLVLTSPGETTVNAAAALLGDLIRVASLLSDAR